MRRALDPFRAVPLLELDEKVESVASAGSYVFVGTTGGNLVQVALELPEASASEKAPLKARCVATVRLSQRRPVEHVCAFGGFVLAIADGVCFSLPVGEFSSAQSTVLGKDARCVCAHTGQDESQQVEFCVSFKKKIVLFSQSGRAFEQTQEFPTNDAACALAWHRSWICAGFKKEYSLYSDRSGLPREICGLDGKVTPRVAVSGDSELLLLIQEGVGLFFDLATQQPSSKSTVTWPRKVVAMGVSGSYAFASVGAGQIDVFGVRDQRPCQTITVGGSALAVCSADDGRAFIASEAALTCLDPVPFEWQIRKLLAQSRVNDALDLLSATYGSGDPRREVQLSRLHKLAGWAQFGELQFTQAFAHFLYSRDFRVARLLLFWQRYLPANWDSAAAGGRPMPDDGAPEPCDLDTYIRSRLVARQDVASDSAVSANVGLANVAMVGFLLKQREALLAQDRLPAEDRPEGAPPPGVLLPAVDIVALKLLLETDEDDLRLQQLLQSGVRCSAEDLEAFLRERRRPDVLARLWTARGKFDLVLREWSALLGGSAEGAGAAPTGSDTLRAAPSAKVVATEFAAALKSASATPVGAELLRQYVPKLLAVDPRAALPIFVSDAAGPAGAAKCPLVADEVLRLLDGHGELTRGFLEHLALTRGAAEARHCSQLASIYLAEVAEERRCGETPATLGPTRQRLLRFLEEAEPLDISVVLPRVEELELHQEKVVLCCREQRHKEALKLLVESLSDLPRAEVYCRLVMGGKAGAKAGRRIQQSIFSADVPPWARSVVFGARRAGAAGEEETPMAPPPPPPHEAAAEPSGTRPLMLLMEVLLAACHGAEQRPADFRKVAAEYKEAVVALLTGYAGHPDLPPHEVIGMLPETWPLAGLAPYLAKCARLCLYQRRAGMLEESLSSMAYLKTFSAWAQERMRKVTITNERACPTCNRRFVDKDAVSKAFAAYPNGTCVHLQCKEDLSVCPKTGRSFADNLSVYCSALGSGS